MKVKSVFGFVVVLFLVTTLAMAAGQDDVQSTADAEGPQYGGTLTVLHGYIAANDPASADVADGFWSSTIWLEPIMDRPMAGDFEKYGPRGTGEFSFEMRAYQPEQYLRGNLIESWEVAREKVTWHVRPGVYYQGRDIMENREYTAEDTKYYLDYYMACPAGKLVNSYIEEVIVIDKYTVELIFERYDLTWLFYLGYEDRASHVPREVYELDASKWENQVGTGPWMVEEYAPASHMSYLKNPIWWDTTTIDGVEYDNLPFIDKMIYPIIPDESTRVAALRTAKIDFFWNTPPTYWENIDKSRPELKNIKYSGAYVYGVTLKCDEPPFDNKEVRRAMALATNRKAFADIQDLGPLPVHTFPVGPQAGPKLYTEFEDLPDDLQAVYEYKPEEAIQILEEQGYPAGDTKFKVDAYVSTTPEILDRTALLKDIWADVGVEVNIIALDPTELSARVRADPVNYDGILVSATHIANPVDMLAQRTTEHFFNTVCYYDEWYDAEMAKIMDEIDVVKRDAMTKELTVYLLEQLTYIPTDPQYNAIYWWPWLQNYYGEVNTGDTAFHNILAKSWLDLELKDSMGY